jgi:outer membrane biosynthesis protein TonB
LVRQESVRQEAARQEAERQAAARQEAAQQEAVEKREAARRAMGRQLDEEAARREAASAAARLLPSSSGTRRYRLFGRADPNAELILYAEAWERKIQLNMTFDMVREAAKLPHTNPIVTVAIRSDGSVESVTFVQSSGVAAIDDAIRRIVHSQEHYESFPPGLAREFDVIEIRRTWYFDVAIRLY